MKHVDRWAAAVVVVGVLTSCGASQDPGAHTASRASTAPATPAGSPALTASRAPTVPTVARDLALAKQALVTPVDLGPPWVEPRKVNTAKGAKGEACKGQPLATTISKPRVSRRVSLTRGTKAGASIGSFEVRTLRPGTERAWRNAFFAETRGCATAISADGTFSTWDIAGAPTVPGSDDVVARIERIYADRSRNKLLYVRHTYEARSGRVVSFLSYAFVQTASDPTGGDLSLSVRLLIRQVAKARATFGL